jgi:hypothetical protein
MINLPDLSAVAGPVCGAYRASMLPHLLRNAILCSRELGGNYAGT